MRYRLHVRNGHLRIAALFLASSLILATAACDRAPSGTGETALAPKPVQPQAAAASTPVPPSPAIDVPFEHTGDAPVASTQDCLAPERAAPVAVSVHRWVDAAGITHYSDQPPPAGARDARVLAVGGLPAITVEASGYDTDLPHELRQRAVSDALGMQRALHDSLGVATPAGLVLHVVFVQAADAYARLVGEADLANSAGAYSTARRTIYVRRQGDDEASFAVLRHELTHALVHESIGNLPTPLNEGLAEYFGRYHGGGLGGQVAPGADRKVLGTAAPSGDGGEALVELLAREDRAFYAGSDDERGRRYLRAYALVALLMRDADGRAALAAVLAAQHAQPCRMIAAETLLARFPGGLAGLARAWSGFMRDPPTDVRAY